MHSLKVLKTINWWKGKRKFRNCITVLKSLSIARSEICFLAIGTESLCWSIEEDGEPRMSFGCSQIHWIKKHQHIRQLSWINRQLTNFYQIWTNMKIRGWLNLGVHLIVSRPSDWISVKRRNEDFRDFLIPNISVEYVSSHYIDKVKIYSWK